MGRWCVYITHLMFSELLLSSLSFPLSRERQPQIDAYSPFSISILVHHIHTRALDLIITSKLPFCKALCTYTYPCNGTGRKQSLETVWTEVSGFGWRQPESQSDGNNFQVVTWGMGAALALNKRSQGEWVGAVHFSDAVCSSSFSFLLFCMNPAAVCCRPAAVWTSLRQHSTATLSFSIAQDLSPWFTEVLGRY